MKRGDECNSREGRIRRKGPQLLKEAKFLATWDISEQSVGRQKRRANNSPPMYF